MAAFIVAQRAEHRVPYATSCRALGMSPAWFYKWRCGDTSPLRARRAQLTEAIRQIFAAHQGTYGSPRITDDLREAGWRVSEKTVAKIMREQHLVARVRKQRRSTTRPGRGRWRAPDLIGRDFPAGAVNQKWYGDGTEIVTDEGKLHLASALAMAVAVRGGREAIAGVILHTDQGSEYTARIFRAACTRMGIVQSMGRVGSALDNAVIESWHSTLEFELRRREHFATKAVARARVAAWIDEYNRDRKHSACGMRSPIGYEQALRAGQRPDQTPAA